MNFSLGYSEIWDPHAHVDSLSDYFSHLLEKHKLCDVYLIKYKPTWRNNRTVDVMGARWIDRFLMVEFLLERTPLFH